MKSFATSITTKWMMRAAIALVATSAGATLCLAYPSLEIESAGPLSHIWVGADLSCQAQHIFDGTTHEFYPEDVAPGDYGTFIAVDVGQDRVLYAPDFSNHDNTATDNTFPNIAFTPVSQNMSGSGAKADPFKVVTVVDLPGTALQIQQTDTYVVGDEFFTTEIMITNNNPTGTADATGVIYRAFDAFLGGSDTGFGFTQALSGNDNRTEVACSVNANNSPPGKIEALIPLTGGNNYFQDEFDLVWSAIGSKMQFADTVSTTLLDNGAGISWNFSIPAGSSKIVAHTTLISSPAGLEPLVTSKTADSPTTPAGGQNGYEITIQNPNASAVTLSSITDSLPAGFAYVPASTTSATTSDPDINGQNLTWSGPFTVPGGGSITLDFAVTVSSIPGSYFNEAGGSASGDYQVIGTGQTAEIVVTAVSAQTTLAVSPATGTYGGFSTITAALSSSNAPIEGATINFTLNGISAGTGVTNAFGVAKSSAVLLVGSSYNAGTYGPAVGTGAEANFDGNASFSASYGNNTLTVSKAALTVAADNKSRPYGFQNPPLTFGFTGFVNSEGDSHGPFASSGVTGATYLTTTATQYSPVGTYPITFDPQRTTLNGGNNYDIKYLDGTLTVSLCGGAIIGLNGISVTSSGSSIDSYYSSLGYQASHDDSALMLSNGTINVKGTINGSMVSTIGSVIVQSGTVVNGNVLYATSLSNSGALTGTPYHQTSTPISLPVPGACGTYTKAPSAGNQWITGAYTYDAAKGNLTVSGGNTAVLANGSYCFNNVTISGGSTLGITGAVVINVTGKFVDSGGSIQNPSLIPSNLQVFSSYTGSNGVTVSGASATYMSIYAPGTGVTVSGGGDLNGSLVGKTLTVSGGSSIHEDLDLPCWQ